MPALPNPPRCSPQQYFNVCTEREKVLAWCSGAKQGGRAGEHLTRLSTCSRNVDRAHIDSARFLRPAMRSKSGFSVWAALFIQVPK
eukprot:6196998-Pleurochrysis_carterae.AAC.1